MPEIPGEVLINETDSPVTAKVMPIRDWEIVGIQNADSKIVLTDGEMDDLMVWWLLYRGFALSPDLRGNTQLLRAIGVPENIIENSVINKTPIARMVMEYAAKQIAVNPLIP